MNCILFYSDGTEWCADLMGRIAFGQLQTDKLNLQENTNVIQRIF